MNNVIKLMIFLTFASISAQNVSFGIYQDGRLAFSNDKSGNKAFTPDLRFELNLISLKNVRVSALYEVADLAGGNYQRWGVQGGKNFDVLKNTQLNPFLGAGMISRMNDNNAWISLEAGIDVSHQLSKNFAISLKQTMTQRGDLEVFNDKAASFRPWSWRYNVYFGIILTIK